MVGPAQKFNRHGFLSAMILHGNHNGVRGISFTTSFQSDLVVEFQWQAGNQNGVFQACKLHYARFPQTRGPTAQRGHLYWQTHGLNPGKESCQLFRAALLFRDKRRFVKLSHVASPVLARTIRVSRSPRDAGTRKDPRGREARLAPKEMAVAFQRIIKNQWQLGFRKMGDRLIRLRLKQICLSLAFVAFNNRELLRHRLWLVNVRFGLNGDVVAFEFAIESCATDPKHLPCERFISVGLFEHAQNRHPLHFR